MEKMNKFEDMPVPDRTTGAMVPAHVAVLPPKKTWLELFSNKPNKNKKGTTSVPQTGGEQQGTASSKQGSNVTVAQLICNKHKAGYTADEISEDLNVTLEFVTSVIHEATEEGLYESLAAFE